VDAGKPVCAHCGHQLVRCCLTCGRPGSSVSRFCAYCGAEREVHRQDTPRELPGVFGERKYITIMFIDMIDSVSATRDLDPEEADELFQRAQTLMREAVNLHSGHVARRLGDGLMALFGAPAALEDHALQACHAALRVLEMGTQARTTHPAFHFRIGIHSGLVVLGRSATDFGVEYEPAGAAVAIAARLQGLAAPNTAVITGATRALLRGRIKTVSMGRHALKGLAEPVEIFEIMRSPVESNGLPAADEPFVNRTEELAALSAAVDSAIQGRGRTVVLLGEAGIGKTRLLQEFVLRIGGMAARVLRVSADRYTGQVPFRSVRRLLETLFGVDTQRPDTWRRRIDERIHTLGLAGFGHELPIHDLFELTLAPGGWQSLDAQMRDRATLAAIKEILAAESRLQPLLIILDDAHWADSATIRLLGFLLREIGDLPILLLISARLGFDPWRDQAGGDDLSVMTIEPLNRSQTDAMHDLLIGHTSDSRLRDLLYAWSLGNPLFVHETVHALLDAGYLAGPLGARHLVREPDGLQPPASVAAIIGERIDRLPQHLRDLLRSASILGAQFTLGTLAELSDEAPANLRRKLDQLVAEDFIRLERQEPEPLFAFRHALFQEVCYTSLLRPHRRELHATTLGALLRAPDRERDASIEQLAHHAFRGGCWDAAVGFSREAAQRAIYRSAHREAARHFETAIAALAELDDADARLTEAIDLRLELRGANVLLLRLDEVGRILDDVDRLSFRLGDRSRQSRITGFMANHAYLTRSAKQAEALASRALELAHAAGDRSLEVAPHFYLGMACHALGQLRRSVDALRTGLDLLDTLDPASRLGFLGRPSIMILCWIALSSAELGDFEAAGQAVATASRHLTGDQQNFEVAYLRASNGFVMMKRGDFEPAVRETEEALMMADERDLPFMVPVAATQLGWLLGRLGRHDKAIALALRGVQAAERIGIVAGRARWVARYADALLLAGRAGDAREQARRSLALAEDADEELYACYSEATLARAEFALYGDAEAAREGLTRAIRRGRSLSLGPFVALCHFDLGGILRAAGDGAASRASMALALEGFRRHGMPAWIGRMHADARPPGR
jgi:class 3 adenylate cyclase/tetratricopeptide (TPR) repeat protein